MSNTDDSAIEKQILAKGLTAPRVTPQDLKDNIAAEYYFTAEESVEGAEYHSIPSIFMESLSLLTFCVLILKNGFTVTGTSACASPENFDAQIGQKIARQDAEQKMWALMGYALKERLANEAA